MKYFYFLALILGAFSLVEVRCEDPIVIRKGDPRDLAEGYSYERLNFLTETIIDGKSVEDQFYWNTCSNYTGINLYLNKTGSKDCLGKVLNCTNNFNGIDLFVSNMSVKPGIAKLITNMIDNKLRGSCHCLCNRLYDPKNHSSIRELLDSICLDEISADVENNYVLTGLRLHRLNNTITFEIQQGQIIEGIVLPSTLQWVPPPKKCNKIGKMTTSKRTLVLDDVILPESMVATGVAFKRYSDIPVDKRRHPESPKVLEKDPFFLSVIGHELSSNYNLNNNKVEISVWNYTLEERTNLINDDMDLSIALMLPFHNHVLSKPKENYVTFGLAVPNEGLRQFIIPYVDSQNVTDPKYPQLVKGIGLYYKGYEGYGGYIAPSIFVPENY